MKIAMMGAGGIGGMFGARLAAAGNDVTFIARGAHLQAIQEQGLKLLSPLGDLHLSDVHATDDPASIGPVDVVLFAVKLYDVEAAAEACKALLKDGTAVISLLNGIDSEARIEAVLGTGHAVGGIAYAPAAIAAPGVIRHDDSFASLGIGEMDGRASARLTDFSALCAEAGFEARVSDQIVTELWNKFVFLATYAAVTCLARQPCGAIQRHGELRWLYEAGMREVAALAAAKGIRLSDDAFERYFKFVDNQNPEAQASMLTDLQAGKRLELNWLSGLVVRMGEEEGIETPVHRVATAALIPYADGPP